MYDLYLENIAQLCLTGTSMEEHLLFKNISEDIKIQECVMFLLKFQIFLCWYKIPGIFQLTRHRLICSMLHAPVYVRTLEHGAGCHMEQDIQ